MNTSPREVRKALGMNQSEFWSRLGVTQSGGSRYENAREMSIPVHVLMELVYGRTPLRALARLRGTTVAKLKEGK